MLSRHKAVKRIDIVYQIAGFNTIKSRLTRKGKRRKKDRYEKDYKEMCGKSDGRNPDRRITFSDRMQ